MKEEEEKKPLAGTRSKITSNLVHLGLKQLHYNWFKTRQLGNCKDKNISEFQLTKETQESTGIVPVQLKGVIHWQ